MADVAVSSMHDLLGEHGLRPTRQRKVLTSLLFAGTSRHVDAQSLHAEAARAGHDLSLATVYNALHDFERAGLLRRIAVPSERIWYDTDTGAHQHFYVEAENRVLDIPENAPIAPPDGYRIQRIDTVVHLERITDDR